MPSTTALSKPSENRTYAPKRRLQTRPPRPLHFRIHDVYKWCVDCLSLEWLLTRFHWPNNGAVVLIRAICCSFLIFTAAHILRNPFDPERTCYFNSEQLRAQITGELHWFGAILAATYTAFYARFASQWTYLASLYSQIKREQCRPESRPNILDEWKAAFIEDAEDLHLATKRAFVFVIFEWGKCPGVKKAFCNGIPSERRRWDSLMRRVEAARQIHICHKIPQVRRHRLAGKCVE